MENIFTLNKDTDYDDTVANDINIDDLYEKKRERDVAQLKIFNRMLTRVHSKIKLVSRQKTSEKICWFVVPEIMLGVPQYDQGSCIAYIMDKLSENGFRVQYIHPNMLLISWSHWVPNYVLQEVKTKTGKSYDNFGNEILPKGQTTYNPDNIFNNKDNDSKKEGDTNILFKKSQGVFQKSKRPSSASKNFTPIDEYKPRGNVVYDETLLFNKNMRS
tara:strand:- start:2471 stop:3118 length:648 start_codon:yes stop_codon:yes gene_type:complete